MSKVLRWRMTMAGLAAALALTACGGSDGDDVEAVTMPPVASGMQQNAAAPVLTNNVAVDGRNWINYRRTQLGVPVVTENAQINNAALGHSEYLRTNNIMSHEQEPGKPGFTGATVGDRLNGAGYTLPATGFAYGEVISGTSNQSGFYMAEELITAIYHRFVMFEPVFQEIGTGAATSSGGYTYFTANFATRGGYGPGIPAGTIVTWPFAGQTQVQPNFFSDFEEPDPVPDRNEVGYPISVHANINAPLTVQSFVVRPRGGEPLPVQQVLPLSTAKTAAAIVPVAPLRGGTTYDVSFSGTVSGAPVTHSWSFTTR
jgi:uncharacterized protein YkwD